MAIRWVGEMARFELTTSNGDKILVDHAAVGMQEFLSELNSSPFVLYTEVKGGTPGAAQVIVASGQITLVRPLSDLSTQSTTFRPKR
jgi:hypothetical protein